jgi:hypothetical protein
MLWRVYYTFRLHDASEAEYGSIVMGKMLKERTQLVLLDIARL